MRLCEKHWIVLPPCCRCIIVLSEAGGRSDYLLLSNNSNQSCLTQKHRGAPVSLFGGQEIADCSKNAARGPLTANETLKNRFLPLCSTLARDGLREYGQTERGKLSTHLTPRRGPREEHVQRSLAACAPCGAPRTTPIKPYKPPQVDKP